MLIRTPPSWQLPESAVTPEAVYRQRSRREFLRTLGLGAAALTFASRDLLAATQTSRTA